MCVCVCVCSTGGSVCIRCCRHCGSVCVKQSLYHSSCSSSTTVSTGPAGKASHTVTPWGRCWNISLSVWEKNHAVPSGSSSCLSLTSLYQTVVIDAGSINLCNFPHVISCQVAYCFRNPNLWSIKKSKKYNIYLWNMVEPKYKVFKA